MIDEGQLYDIEGCGQFLIFEMSPPFKWKYGVVIRDGVNVVSGLRLHVLENFKGIDIICNAMCTDVDTFNRIAKRVEGAT